LAEVDGFVHILPTGNGWINFAAIARIFSGCPMKTKETNPDENAEKETTNGRQEIKDELTLRCLELTQRLNKNACSNTRITERSQKQESE